LGFFAYKVMPFGITFAPSTFCSLVSVAFEGLLGTEIEAWMDDLACADDDVDTHFEKLKKILIRCRIHKLSLNPAKCELGVPGIVWCGSFVSRKGREADKAKVQAVLKWPPPQIPYEVIRYLNFAGYYRPLIKNYAAMTAPLQKLTRDIRIRESARRKDGAGKRSLARSTSSTSRVLGVE